MSTNYKPLSEQIAGKMVSDLKNGNSIFQRPNNNMNSALPFNLESGKRYIGTTALTLLMQKRDDPRWGTSNQANRNHTAVIKGSTGTLINFLSNYEFQQVMKDGEPALKENGKPRYERMKLDEPKLVEAWMFNGEQLRKIEKWEKEPNVLSPAERAQLILENSGVTIELGGDDMFYDNRSDTIVMPEKQYFANPEQYYAEALHQLAHWTGAEHRLNRPQEGSMDQLTNIREELRTNLASLFLGKELNLPYELNYHDGYVNSWAAILKDEPGELFKAAEDAQKIVDLVLGYENKREEIIEASQDEVAEESRETGIDAPKIDPSKLNVGEVIPYNGKEYKVLDQVKKTYKMEDSEGQKFDLTKSHGLYKSLIEARNNSQERASETGRDLLLNAADAVEHSQGVGFEETEVFAEMHNNHLQLDR
ncbi:MAG: DUF1738 domain-containing protein [Bacteroidetes bacterium]|nr:DUF1738 domain-containing protein [Bacteroidota bacterium]